MCTFFSRNVQQIIGMFPITNNNNINNLWVLYSTKTVMMWYSEHFSLLYCPWSSAPWGVYSSVLLYSVLQWLSNTTSISNNNNTEDLLRAHIHPAGSSMRESRNTGASPFDHDKCPGFFYVHCTTHGTYSFTSHPKDEAIMVKCLAQGHKRCDRPGRDSNPHSDNTRTRVQCTRPLGHDTLSPSQVPNFTNGWREASRVKFLALGHN